MYGSVEMIVYFMVVVVGESRHQPILTRFVSGWLYQ